MVSLRSPFLLALSFTMACSGAGDSSPSGAAASGGAGGASAGGSAGSSAGAAGTAGGAGAGAAGVAGAAGQPPSGYGAATTLSTGLAAPARTLLTGHYVVVSLASNSIKGGVHVYDLATGTGKDHTIGAITTVLLRRSDDEAWFAQVAGNKGAIKTLQLATLAEGPVFDTPLAGATDFVEGGGLHALVGGGGVVEVRDGTTHEVKFSSSIPGAQTTEYFHGAFHVADYDGGRVLRLDGPSGNVKVWHKGLTNPFAIITHGAALVVAEETDSGRLLALDDSSGTVQETVLAQGLVHPLRVASYGGDLYWTEEGTCVANNPLADGRVVWRKADGTLVTIADKQTCARGISVSDSGVYWLTREGSFNGSLHVAKPLP